MIGHRWGFRGNIKHPTQCWICPGFDSRAEIISTVYCLPLPFDVRLTNTCKKPGHEAMSGRRKSHGKGAKRLFSETFEFPVADVYLFMFVDAAALGASHRGVMGDIKLNICDGRCPLNSLIDILSLLPTHTLTLVFALHFCVSVLGFFRRVQVAILSLLKIWISRYNKQ